MNSWERDHRAADAGSARVGHNPPESKPISREMA